MVVKAGDTYLTFMERVPKCQCFVTLNGKALSFSFVPQERCERSQTEGSL